MNWSKIILWDKWKTRRPMREYDLEARIKKSRLFGAQRKSVKQSRKEQMSVSGVVAEDQPVCTETRKH